MKPEKSLISGSTAMLILKLLSEKDMYGYEMIETLQRQVAAANGYALADHRLALYGFCSRCQVP